MPEINYRRPALKDYQTAALFHDKRYAFIEGTSKAGKTYAGLTWLGEQALFGKPRDYWWVAPVYGQADIAYRRFKRGARDMIRKTNDTDHRADLINDHSVWFKSAEKPDNLFGEDVGAIVLDEASRAREESWHACRTTVTATRGKMRCIGNVKGKKNWFYKLCREAEKAMASSSPSELHYGKITAHDAVKAGVINAEEVEDARRILPEAVFNELYLAIPNEDGSNPFGLQHIAACAVEGLSGAPVICNGADLAKSVDWTALIGLDQGGGVAAFDRFQKPWEATIEDILAFGGRAPFLVDSTGVGDPILERLQKLRPNRFEGYKFTSESKQKLMEGLAVAIQSGMIRYPHGPIRSELESFEFEYTRTGVRYSAPEGMNDDCVMALALAWQLFSTKPARPASVWNGAREGGVKKPAWMP